MYYGYGLLGRIACSSRGGADRVLLANAGLINLNSVSTPSIAQREKEERAFRKACFHARKNDYVDRVIKNHCVPQQYPLQEAHHNRTPLMVH